MPLLDAIKTALGLDADLVPGDGGPFRLGEEAARVVASLPPGRALHVVTVPVAGGFAPHAYEGPADGHRVVIADADRERLRGIVLDHDGERFVPRPALVLVPRETPNPEGRKYETDRVLALGGAQEFRRRRLPQPPLAARVLAIAGVTAVLFRDGSLTVLREPGTAWGPVDRAVEAALREHLLLGGRPLPEPVALVPDDDLAARVQEVIAASVMEKVRRDGGDLVLLGVADGVVRLRLVGACRACPVSAVTLQAGVRAALEQALPGRIRAVEAVDPYEPTEP